MTMGHRQIDATAARCGMLLAQRLPRPLVQPILDWGIARVRQRHADIFETLEEYGPVTVVVDPSDLPLVLSFRLGRQPRLFLERRHAGDAAATVRGSFDTLLDLLEGRVDGDTLFFERRLEVKGRIDLVVALRNTLDGRGISFANEVSASLGPLGPTALFARDLLATVLSALDGFAARPRSESLKPAAALSHASEGGK